MGSHIRHGTELSNREAIASDLEKLGSNCSDIAYKLIALSVHASGTFRDIIGAYEQLQESLKRARQGSKRLPELAADHRALVSLVDDRLKDLGTVIEARKHQIFNALKFSRELDDQVIQSQHHKGAELVGYLSNPTANWLSSIPWLETTWKSERKKLETDLNLTTAVLAELEELQMGLIRVSGALGALRESMHQARKTNSLDRFSKYTEDRLFTSLKESLANSTALLAGW
jgi:hypothetical protein